MLAARVFDLILWLHITGAVVGFGSIIAYPRALSIVRDSYPESLPGFHKASEKITGKLLTPAMGVVLLTGAYLATDAKAWPEVWVSVPLLIIAVLFGLMGGVLTPGDRKASSLAARDLHTADGTLSSEYTAVARRLALTTNLASSLVVVAIFFMVVKP